jgi:hypothetical protein
MKPPMFHVGQAVLAVGIPGVTPEPQPGETYPTKGEIYHVREWRFGRGRDATGKHTVVIGISLVEITNPSKRRYLGGWAEVVFNQDCFAPVELLPSEAIAELLRQTLEPVTA